MLNLAMAFGSPLSILISLIAQWLTEDGRIRELRDIIFLSELLLRKLRFEASVLRGRGAHYLV